MRTSQPRPLQGSMVYLAVPTSCSLLSVSSTLFLAGLWVPLRDLDLAGPTGDGDLLRSSSAISALLPLLSLGDETDEVLRRLRGAYRSIDPLLFPLRGLLVRLRLRLTLRDRLLLGLRRRRGVMLRSRLLLRVSRCSSRSRPLRLDVTFALMRSRSGLREARLRTGDLPRALEERDAERERDREELALRLLRDLGGGERLLEMDGDLLRLRGGGEGERELVEEKDLRRRRSGLRPLPLPPRPR